MTSRPEIVFNWTGININYGRLTNQWEVERFCAVLAALAPFLPASAGTMTVDEKGNIRPLKAEAGK